jgi:hypothetical protein
MYVWTVKVEEHWSWMGSKNYYDDSGTEFSVAAKTADQAFEKARKLATAKSRGYEDDDGKMVYCTDVRLIGIERGVSLDA